MKKLVTILCALGTAAAFAVPAFANNTYQALPFAQDWTNTGLITVNDDWSGVPGIVGFRGDDMTISVGVDPQTLLGDGTITVDINANIPDASTQLSGGLYEDEIANPTVCFQGSGTADAPSLTLYINATGKQNINVKYQLRDVDGSTDVAIQPVALQFRTGPGAWTNVAAGFVANGALAGAGATGNTSLVNVTLPAAANGAATLEIRMVTANAVGNDQQVGIDDISVTGEDIPTPAATTSWGKVKGDYR